MNASDINLEYCRASSGQRLANYLIDLVAFYVILFFLGMITEILLPGSMSDMNVDPIIDRVITIIIYGLIMFVIEMAFQGKSLGKLITGTRAVTQDGATLSFEKCLIRNFVRAIPFNALSALGSPCAPWHDKWSDTLVVDDKKVELAKRKEEFYSGLKTQEDIS